MKIVGINVSVLDGGIRRVSVTGEFAKNEDLEEGDTDRLLSLIQEHAACRVTPVSREPAAPAEEAAPAATAGRRRHVNPLGDGETGEKPDPTEAAPTGRRARRPVASTAEAPAPETKGSSAPDAAPSEGGRRRRRTVEEAHDEKAQSAPDPTPAPSAGRRRRGSSADAPTAPTTQSTDEGDITDVDLTRTASQAADKISTAKVKELLKKYEVSKVNEIFPAHRKRFLKELAALVKAES